MSSYVHHRQRKSALDARPERRVGARLKECHIALGTEQERSNRLYEYAYLAVVSNARTCRDDEPCLIQVGVRRAWVRRPSCRFAGMSPASLTGRDSLSSLRSCRSPGR